MNEDLLSRLEGLAANMRGALVAGHETPTEAAALIRDMQAALDLGSEGSGMWRFWAKKAAEVAKLAAIDRKLAQKTANDAAMWKARAECAEAKIAEAGLDQTAFPPPAVGNDVPRDSAWQSGCDGAGGCDA